MDEEWKEHVEAFVARYEEIYEVPLMNDEEEDEEIEES